ncbi:feruloyl-CoA synthase [Steroidobacter denitrificans]|uniref:Feruloyl-CoA synthase n=1 Tax=Steroidobacter denitrificans TaxID=465721 RepID=A0A127FDR4_STEDE|nr:AMP-binding protein [Steroidobacter denitrificans]AMN47769.1 feruloyl-CoA synthase [Steroidobacter denitrificans]
MNTHGEAKPRLHDRLLPVDESCKVESRADGSFLIRRNIPLEAYPHRCTELLLRWAREVPDRVFIAQRPREVIREHAWEEWTYGMTLAAVRSLGQALLDRRLSVERPVMILSENQIENQLLALACSHVGVPYIPVAPAYSLQAKDHDQLKWLAALCRPGLVYASSSVAYRRAVKAAFPQVEWVTGQCDGDDATPLDALLRTEPTAAVERAYEAISPNQPVKVLFTSGTTGRPKGVIFTHEMICCNRQQLIQTLPAIYAQPPVLVDWLPWHHTFGGTFCVGIALTGGGSFYIDPGQPVPGRIDGTLQALREIAPTFYGSTPGGMAALLPHLSSDEPLRKNFFSRLRVMNYGGALCPPHVRRGFDEVTHQAGGEVSYISIGGSTECGPCALVTMRDPGCEPIMGVPVPGMEVKLAPVDDKLELRFKGPSVTPGYWRQPELNERAFDEEGFFRLGDAASFVDLPGGDLRLRLEGRLAENFKLITGTWVNTETLRLKALAAFAALARDVVIVGEGQSEVGALVFPNLDVCRTLDPSLPDGADPDRIVASVAVRGTFEQRLGALNADQGSAGRIVRLMLEPEPPTIDSGELTAKQSVSPLAVLRRRAAAVEALFQEPVVPRVIRWKGSNGS